MPLPTPCVKPDVDFGKPVLTYMGLDPLEPDDELLDEFVPQSGLDMGRFLA